MNQTFHPKKLSDLDALIPGFQKIWKAIKADTGTSQRCPKTVTFTDTAQPMCLDDRSCGRRFALDLTTMQLSKSVHVSAGEWAVHAGPNHDEALKGVGNGQALISCEWNDYYRSFYINIQVAPGSIPQQLPSKED